MTTDRGHLLKLATSFPYFVESAGAYLGFDVPDLHVDMAEAFASGYEYVGISAFRNSAKSYLAELYAGWRLFLNPSLWILVVSGESSRAEQFSSSVGGLLSQVPWLQHLAPSKPSKSFNVRGIAHGEWPSLTSRTSRGNLRGPRADLVILDDPIGTRDKDSPAVREKVNSSLHEIPLILNPAGRQFLKAGVEVPDYAKTRCLCLFTPTDTQPNDFYQKSESSFFDRFKVYRFPAILDAEYDENGLVTTGTSAWPERWPIEALIEEQNRNPFVFKVERQVDNTPQEDERSLIRFGKIPQREATPKSLVCFVDPSGGSDEYAYSIGGLDRGKEDSSIHIKRVGGWRGLPPDEAGRELLDVLHEEGVTRLYVEENFPVSSGLRRMATERKQALAVETFKSSKRKESRLKERLPTILNSGAVSFDPAILSDDETVRQLRGLRATPGLPPQDDRLDAIEFLVSHFEPHARVVHKSNRTNGPKRVRYA